MKWPEKIWMLSALVLSCAAVALEARRHRVLLYPVSHCYNSLLHDFEKVGSYLSHQDYDVTMIVSSNYNGSKGDLDMSHVDMAYFPAPDGVLTMCDMENLLARAEISMIQIINTWTMSSYRFCDTLLKSDLLASLKDKDFDVLIVDRSDWCSAIVTEYLRVPFITFASVPTAFSEHELARYIHLPTIFTAYSLPMSAGNRIMNILTHVLMYYIRIFPLMPMNNLKQLHGINASRYIADVYEDSVVTLLNSDQRVDYPHPIYEHEVEVGFLFPSISPTRIPHHLQQSMGNDRLIVISFGSQVASLRRDWSETLISALGNFSHKVIWRLNNGKRSAVNIVELPWIPQTALLASGQVDLLITHGGMASTMEAIYFGVPMLILPMQAEQAAQAAKLTEYLRVAETLDLHELTEHRVTESITRLIHKDSEAHRNVMRLSRLISSHPTKPADKLLYWLNLTASHKQELDLYTPRKPQRQHGLQWILLDFVCIIATTLIILLFCFIYSCKLILKYVFS